MEKQRFSLKQVVLVKLFHGGMQSNTIKVENMKIGVFCIEKKWKQTHLNCFTWKNIVFHGILFQVTWKMRNLS